MSKAGRLENGWQKLEQHGVIKELCDTAELRKAAVEQHLAGLRGGKTSLMICPRHEEARKVATIMRQQLKTQGAIGAEGHALTILRRMESRHQILPGPLTLRAWPSGRARRSVSDQQ